MKALSKRGVRVPEDISIVGFDDNLYSSVCSPALTTVHQDADLKGQTAACLLIRLIQGERPEKKEIKMETRLVIRETVRRI